MKESNCWRLNQRIFPSTNLVEIILFPSACFVNRTIARFENGVSLIYAVSISDGNTRIELKDDLGVIGWGYTIASALLTLRECHRKLRLPYTAYLAYEAKRASEKTGFVGQFTALLIQAPGADIKDRAYLKTEVCTLRNVSLLCARTVNYTPDKPNQNDSNESAEVAP
jgi:hypothetical protein